MLKNTTFKADPPFNSVTVTTRYKTPGSTRVYLHEVVYSASYPLDTVRIFATDDIETLLGFSNFMIVSQQIYYNYGILEKRRTFSPPPEAEVFPF